MSKTLIAWTVVFFLTVAGIWYFAVKKYDYTIRFETSVNPSEIYQKLLYYEFQEFEKVEVDARAPFKNLVQKGELKGKDLKLSWELSKENDTVTNVLVGIKNTENPFKSRLQLLTGSGTFKEKAISEIKQFKKALEKDSDLYNIDIKGETMSPETTCACIYLKNTVNMKALDMVQNINTLSGFMVDNDLEMEAKPRIQVLKWDVTSNSIDYNFCFPIDPAASPKPSGDIFITKIPAQNSLMAIYNGNYMYSHLAWVRLLDYAAENNLKLEQRPLEIFNDNPEMGGDSRNWEAEIYLPIK